MNKLVVSDNNLVLSGTKLAADGLSDFQPLTPLSWEWARVIENDSGTSINDIAASSHGCYVAGFSWETMNFDSHTVNWSIGNDIFLAYIEKDGSWEWARNGDANSQIHMGAAARLCYDGNHIYCAGRFIQRAIFDSVSLLPVSGSVSGYVAQFDPFSGTCSSGVAFGNERCTGVKVGADGSIYVTGVFTGTISFGGINLTSNGSLDLYVAKRNSAGTWIWAVQGGSAGYDESQTLEIDSEGNCYLIAYGVDPMTFGGFSVGSGSYFVKVSHNGTFASVTSLPNGIITTTLSGIKYMCGSFTGSITLGSTTLTATSAIYVACLDSNNNFIWAYQSEPMNCTPRSIVFYNDRLYVSGDIGSGNPIFGTNELTNKSSFIAEFNIINHAFEWGIGINGGWLQKISVDSDCLYAHGPFQGDSVIVFDDNLSLNRNALEASYVAKLTLP